jgi:hypothetical protein
MKKTAQNYSPVLFVVLAVYLLFRVLPAFWHSLGSYGYDFGFYLYAAKHISLHGWQDILVGVSGGYTHPLFWALKLFGANTASGLSALLFLVSMGVGAAFYVVSPNPRVGLWAVLLAALSVPQSEGYLLFLLKGEVGLILLLLSFAALIRQRYVLASVLGVLLLFSHRTSVLMYGLALGCFVLWEQIKKKQLWLVLLEVAAIALSLFVFRSVWLGPVHAFLGGQNQAVLEGVFLYGQSFIGVVWPFVIAAAIGIYFYVKNKQHPLLLIFFLVTVLWSVFHLPFYNRVLLFVDVGLILFTAYFFASSWLVPKVRLAVISLFLIVMSYNVLSFLARYQPLISSSEISEIEQRHFPPGSFVVALSANDAPWLLGYLPYGVRLSAPGLFEDRHTYGEWVAFWSGETDYTFFAGLPRPLYVYARSFEAPPGMQKCLREVSTNFSEVTCP